MTKSQISFLGSLLASGALVFAGCGGGGGGSTGTGGATGGGGHGTGGMTAGTGGMTAGTGGHADAGSDTSSDVAGDVQSGAGGSDAGPGTDAADAMVDAGPVHLVNYTFDTTVQGWGLNTFDDPANLASQMVLDGGHMDGGVPPTFTFEPTIGSPAPGSLKITATFTAYGQSIDPVINFASMDLTGKTLHAKVMLASGTFPGYAVIHASSTSSYIYDAKGYNGLSAGTWTDLAFDLSTATSTNWTPAQIVQIGVQIGSGGAPPDASATFATPLSVTIYIDTVTD